MTGDYHINVFYSQDDDGYIADIPDLEACSACGASPQVALEEVLQAKDAWLAAARERGIAIRPPALPARAVRVAHERHQLEDGPNDRR